MIQELYNDDGMNYEERFYLFIYQLGENNIYFTNVKSLFLLDSWMIVSLSSPRMGCFDSSLGSFFEGGEGVLETLNANNNCRF